jgi:TIR domain
VDLMKAPPESASHRAARDARGYVFISYARKDSSYVASPAAYLEAHDVPAWYDQEIPNGERWRQILRSRMEQAAAVLLVESPSAQESEWVEHEIIHAERHRRPMLVLHLEGELRYGIAELQAETVAGGMPSERFVARARDLVAQRRSTWLRQPHSAARTIQPAGRTGLSVLRAGEPPHDRMLAKTGWRICGQCPERFAQLVQARPSAREASVVAVHDPHMVGYQRNRNAEGADVLGDDHPGLGCCRLEDAPVVSPAQLGPVRVQGNRVYTFGDEFIGEPYRIMLIKQEPDLSVLRRHQALADVPTRAEIHPGWRGAD